MFNMSEKDLRAIETIEESVLQSVFKTKKSCSRHLLYLESGMIPARYQIHRQMINYLQYILLQPSDSLLNKVFAAQKSNPARGDWVSQTTKLLTEYSFNLTFEEIKQIKPSLFKRLVKKQVHGKAFEDLMNKKNSGEKGRHIHYEKHEMASYLLSKSNFSVTDKLEIFAIRCEMNDLPFNFGNKTNCEMGCHETIMNTEHLLNCPKLNENLIKLNLENILNGSNQQKKIILSRINRNNGRRIEYLQDSVSYC